MTQFCKPKKTQLIKVNLSIYRMSWIFLCRLCNPSLIEQNSWCCVTTGSGKSRNHHDQDPRCNVTVKLNIGKLLMNNTLQITDENC